MEPFTTEAFTERYGHALDLGRAPLFIYERHALEATQRTPAGGTSFVLHEVGTRSGGLLIAGITWRFGEAVKLLIISALPVQFYWRDKARLVGLEHVRLNHSSRIGRIPAEAEADVIVLDGRSPDYRDYHVFKLRERFPEAVIIVLMDTCQAHGAMVGLSLRLTQARRAMQLASQMRELLPDTEEARALVAAFDQTVAEGATLYEPYGLLNINRITPNPSSEEAQQ